MISVIFPTRERPSLLYNLITSISHTTHSFEDIEVLVAYDDDDNESKKVLKNLSEYYNWLKPHVRKRGNNLSRDYHNWLFQKTIGEYIIVTNDDVEFKTNYWDRIITDKITNYKNINPDGIIYGWISDSTWRKPGNKKEPYSCFPLLSRKSIDLLGYAMNPYYAGWSADVHLYEVYNKANRILDLSEILLQHYTHWLKNREKDNTTKNIEKISINKNIINTTNDSNKLINYIKCSFVL